MDTFLIKAVQLILAFAILVIIHEFGHFLFARIFGVKVEKFYIFFDPWTELFKWRKKRYIGGLGHTHHFSDDSVREHEEKKRLRQNESRLEAAMQSLKKASDDQQRLKLQEEIDHLEDELAENEKIKIARDDADYAASRKESAWKRFWGHTEYGIGWLPLGGYCKISGMIDESMDTSQMRHPAKPWEFRSKPAWQRLLIMVAGVLFNFLLAIVIYAGIVYATGEKYVPFDKATMGMAYSGEAKNVGFRDGDIPLAVDGETLDNPLEGRAKIVQGKIVTVLRDGKKTDISLPDDFVFRLDKEMKSDSADINFMAYRIPVEITQVMPGEGAAKAGIRAGDRIVAIDTIATPSIEVFFRTLRGHDNSTVPFSVARKNEAGLTDTLTVNVTLSENSKMGVGLQIDPSAFYDAKEIRYGLLESIPRGVEMGTDKLTSYAKSMKLVFTKEGAKQIGGFGAIGSIFPEKWDWLAFWNIAAFLSVALAFMNILPIPALDGGHVFFLLYEVVTRRKPSEKFMEYAQMIGMGLLLLLLIYANGMDIVRLFR